MKSSGQIQTVTRESRFLARLINPGKNLDYLFAFVIGALPIVVAYLVGAAKTIELPSGITEVEIRPEEATSYSGYMDSFNWYSLALLIPITLFAIRWLMRRIAPVQEAWPPANQPPILKLVSDESSKPAVYSSLRQSVLSRYNLLCAFGIVALITILDGWPLLMPYFSDALPLYTDWRAMFKIEANLCGDPPCHVSKAANLMLLLIASLAQVTITFFGIITVIFLFRHNWFFIRNVYQRRRTSTIAASEMFQIDVTDADRCFGFRKANSAFNTQVIALMLGGVVMAFSRYAFSVPGSASIDFRNEYNEDENLLTNSFINFSTYVKNLLVNYAENLDFSLAGQWLMPLIWIGAYFIVALPVWVKLLPRAAGLLPRLAHKHLDEFDGSIGHYLREFFPDDGWPRDTQGNEESVSLVAARFARNAFWPTGDNRARFLFFFSWFIFFFTMFPPPPGLLPFIIFIVIDILLAFVFTLGTYIVIKLLLGYVDYQLINASKIDSDLEQDGGEAQSAIKQDVGVFLSYRRKDTVEYARSIHAELLKHFSEERLFRDLSAIEPGQNFVTAIDRSLKQVDNILVLIGADWVSSADSQGRLRLRKPDDMVRIEVATALKSGKRVIPVLLEDAMMPSQSELPDELHGLCVLNALEITDSRWEYDVGRLIETLKTS